jgi:transcriptional regulator with XRE-family HTH domain
MSSELVKALKALPANPKRRVIAALGFRGTTQVEMAGRTGIDKGVLSTALNGHRELTDEQKNAVAKYLDLPRAVLFPEVAA